MGVRRAQHVSVQLAMQVVVTLEAAGAVQQTPVLETPHRLSDPELAHDVDPLSVVSGNCPLARSHHSATPARVQVQLSPDAPSIVNGTGGWNPFLSSGARANFAAISED